VARSILENGPQTAAALAEQFGLTPAGVRRHLDALVSEGMVEAQPERLRGPRGRGRPAKVFALTDAGREHFHHMHYFNLPGVAERDLDARPREFLTRVFHTLSGAGDYLHTWQSPPDAHYVDAMEPAPPLPWSWLTAAELELYVENYSAGGFTGPLSWYRAGDLRWEQRKRFEGRRLEAPYYFIGSEHDIDLAVFHGTDPLEKFGEYYTDVRSIRLLPGAGHLMQMETPEPVTAAMLEALTAITNPDGGDHGPDA
jgi:DNA-binding MarR family transcriptional regulator